MKIQGRLSEGVPSAAGFCAWVACLVAWVFSTPALVPVIVCLIGGLDGQHQVLIAEGRDATLVVFHHEGGVPAAGHRHSILSEMFVVLSKSSTETQDHLLVFPRGEVSTVDERLVMLRGELDSPPSPCEWHLCAPLDCGKPGFRDRKIEGRGAIEVPRKYYGTVLLI